MPTFDWKHVAILVFYAAFTAVINLIFSKRSQIDEWCEANPKLAALAKLCRGFGVDPWTIFQSLVLAVTKRLPDYQKQSLVELKAKRAPSVPPFAGLLAIVICVSLSGCAWFKGSFWPKVEQCAPSPATLVQEVATILAGGGDYEAALEQAAAIEGKEAVLCAVKAFESSIGGPEHENAPAKARGRAFLAKVAAQ